MTRFTLKRRTYQAIDPLSTAGQQKMIDYSIYVDTIKIVGGFATTKRAREYQKIRADKGYWQKDIERAKVRAQQRDL